MSDGFRPDVTCGVCGWLISREEWDKNRWYCPTCKPSQPNAELLRLLERHHAASIAENRLHPADDLLYSDSELCRLTEAAIERAKEQP